MKKLLSLIALLIFVGCGAEHLSQSGLGSGGIGTPPNTDTEDSTDPSGSPGGSQIEAINPVIGGEQGTGIIMKYVFPKHGVSFEYHSSLYFEERSGDEAYLDDRDLVDEGHGISFLDIVISEEMNPILIKEMENSWERVTINNLSGFISAANLSDDQGREFEKKDVYLSLDETRVLHAVMHLYTIDNNEGVAAKAEGDAPSEGIDYLNDALNSIQIDTTPPQVTGVSLPETHDAGEPLTITMTIVDDLSGVGVAHHAYFANLSEGEDFHGFISFPHHKLIGFQIDSHELPLTPIGNDQYQLEIPVSAYLAPGQYHLMEVFLCDKLYNCGCYYGSYPDSTDPIPADLACRGMMGRWSKQEIPDVSFQLNNDGPVDDGGRPVILSLSTSPGTIQAGESFKVELVVDSLAPLKPFNSNVGVDIKNLNYNLFVHEEEVNIYAKRFVSEIPDWVQIEGNRYELHYKTNPYLKPGTYYLKYCTIEDELNHYSQYQMPSLGELIDYNFYIYRGADDPADLPLIPVQSVTILNPTGEVDSEPPIIRSVTASSDVVNAGEEFEVLVETSDDLSGISKVTGTFRNMSDDPELQGRHGFAPNRVEYRGDNIYALYFKTHYFSLRGDYVLISLYVSDKIGSVRDLVSADGAPYVDEGTSPLPADQLPPVVRIRLQ